MYARSDGGETSRFVGRIGLGGAKGKGVWDGLGLCVRNASVWSKLTGFGNIDCQAEKIDIKG